MGPDVPDTRQALHKPQGLLGTYACQQALDQLSAYVKRKAILLMPCQTVTSTCLAELRQRRAHARNQRLSASRGAMATEAISAPK